MRLLRNPWAAASQSLFPHCNYKLGKSPSVQKLSNMQQMYTYIKHSKRLESRHRYVTYPTWSSGMSILIYAQIAYYLKCTNVNKQIHLRPWNALCDGTVPMYCMLAFQSGANIYILSRDPWQTYVYVFIYMFLFFLNADLKGFSEPLASVKKMLVSFSCKVA